MFQSQFIFLFILFGLQMQAQTFQKDSLALVSVLQAQEKAWNAYDIDIFMEGYWKSPNLVFCGSGGPVYGWNATKKRYKQAYDNQEKMGKLQFTILNVQALTNNVMQLIGRFQLSRKPKNTSGYFTLLWKRIDGEWKIVSDHTSASS
ncbi:MAG: nuclear transport factor 2 family protein [Flavobacteriaceae bacterium TMED120]|nr:MAG: nuclear transport factor 2 family protein [Flavobacteriaceae bacterium TMED120]